MTKFDDDGLGQEPNNLAAINSLRGYRSLRWGRHVELIITDERSYRSEDPGTDIDGDALSNKDFDEFIPEEVLEIIDGGREYNGGKPPDAIPFGDKKVLNTQKNQPAQTILGAEQKKWFLDQLRESKATWKIWGSTTATLPERVEYRQFLGSEARAGVTPRADVYIDRSRYPSHLLSKVESHYSDQ